MQPAGIASIAARVEIGDDQDSGVARSSRAGTKRSVKAGPTMRGWPGRSGRVPRSQTLRRPFFSSTWSGWRSNPRTGIDAGQARQQVIDLGARRRRQLRPRLALRVRGDHAARISTYLRTASPTPGCCS
jgi:hypothetical protein